MVEVRSYVVSAPETEAALESLDAKIAASDVAPSLAYVFYGSGHDDSVIHAFLSRRFPGLPVIGGTSCAGVMNEERVWDAHSIGMLLIEDSDGDYGAAAAPLGPDAAATAAELLTRALDNAGCAGELPELIWIYQAPGREEQTIAGLRSIVGDRCPIIGGSSADDTVAGDWRQLGPDGPMTEGLVVAVLFSSGGIGFAFQGGYEPTGKSGVVSHIEGDGTGPRSGRKVVSIDDQPAAQVYNDWIGGMLDAKMAEGGNILADTTMFPLGIDNGEIDGVTQYLLVHPDAVTPGAGLSTFATLTEGTRVYGMCGNKQRLVERAGRVAASAASALDGGVDNLAGGLIVYCAGCKLAVGDLMAGVSGQVATSFEGQPFLGCFTFGEQGHTLSRNMHGNLMISAIAFGR
ncbi:MAG: hypothetical protein CMM50_09355 [Rhodospirillaceae bacterium]|nr:hypothetical protein [Rhodospirillaceae bacterium]|tara:strand:- start:914 stop:2122 length:1209 start_codon:yes stop_codon:yes gene_type:complete